MVRQAHHERTKARSPSNLALAYPFKLALGHPFVLSLSKDIPHTEALRLESEPTKAPSHSKPVA